MKALNLQNRTVGLIENGSWAPVSGKLMRAELESMKGMQILEPVVSIKSSVKEETKTAINQLKDAVLSSLSGK